MTRRATASPSLGWFTPLGRTTSVTTRAFNRIPSEKTFAKSLRRRSRRSGPNRRSEDPHSGREFGSSLRTPRAEDSPSCLGGHSGPEAMTPLAFEVARLKCAFHRTVSTPVRIRRRSGSACNRRAWNLQAGLGQCQFNRPNCGISPFVWSRRTTSIHSTVPPLIHRSNRQQEYRKGANGLGTLSRSA